MSIELTGNMVAPGNDGVRPEPVARLKDAKQGDAAFDKALEKAESNEPASAKRTERAAVVETGRKAGKASNKADVPDVGPTAPAGDGEPAMAGKSREAETAGSTGELEPGLQEAMETLLAGKNLKMKKNGAVDLKGVSDSKGVELSGLAHGLKGSDALIGGKPSLKGLAKEGPARISDKLREAAMLDGKSPEEVEIDEQGALVLAGILKELGVGEDQIKELLAGVKETSGGKPLSLSDLMTRAEELEFQPGVADEGKETLEITALPFIESLLSLMGTKPADVKNVLQAAVTDGDKIDLKKLVSALKDLPVEPGRIEPLQPGGGQAAQAGKLMAGIGFGMEAKVPLTVGEFASRLEVMAAGNASPQRVGGKQAAGLPNNPMGKARGGKFAAQVEKNAGAASAGAAAPGKSDPSSVSMETSLASAGKTAVPSGEMARVAASVAAGSELTGASELKPGALTEMGLSHEVGDDAPLIATAGATHDIHGKEVPVALRGQERLLPTYVADQVGRQIYRAVRNGESEIRFQINPATLGKIRMSMEKTSEGVKVVIFAEQNTTRDMLMAGTNDMKNLLAEQGVKVDRIEVDLSGNFGDTLAGAQQGPGDSGGRGGRSGGGGAGGRDRNVEHVTGETSATGEGRGNGILDLVA